MGMKTHVEFTSTKFPPYPDEEEGVNAPAIYGRRLAEYLLERLPAYGLETLGLSAEDWGWIVFIENDAYQLWVGCGNYPELENGFLCFIEPSKPVIRKWFSKIDTTETISRVAQALESIFSEDPEIKSVRWWAEDET